MNRKTLLIGALVGVALTAVVACGSSDTPTPTPDASGHPVATFDPNATPTSRPTRTAAPTPVGALPQPCSLLNPADVQSLIGTITDNQPTAGECHYTGDTGTLTVHLETKATTEAEAAQKLAGIAGPTAEAAAVTDQGFYVSDSEIAGRKGLYVFTLTTTKPAKQVLLSLAQAASANLPSS